MGDVGEDFKALKELRRKKAKQRLESANPEHWNIHTDFHWSRVLNGKRLDYWPSKSKFMYEGMVMTGDVLKFIAKRIKN